MLKNAFQEVIITVVSHERRGGNDSRKDDSTKGRAEAEENTGWGVEEAVGAPLLQRSLAQGGRNSEDPISPPPSISPFPGLIGSTTSPAWQESVCKLDVRNCSIQRVHSEGVLLKGLTQVKGSLFLKCSLSNQHCQNHSFVSGPASGEPLTTHQPVLPKPNSKYLRGPYGSCA